MMYRAREDRATSSGRPETTTTIFSEHHKQPEQNISKTFIHPTPSDAPGRKEENESEHQAKYTWAHHNARCHQLYMYTSPDTIVRYILRNAMQLHKYSIVEVRRRVACRICCAYSEKTATRSLSLSPRPRPTQQIPVKLDVANASRAPELFHQPCIGAQRSSRKRRRRDVRSFEVSSRAASGFMLPF